MTEMTDHPNVETVQRMTRAVFDQDHDTLRHDRNLIPTSSDRHEGGLIP